MTGVVIRRIRCDARAEDGFACMAEHDAPFELPSFQALRKWLHKSGWRVNKKGQDICPGCWAEGNRGDGARWWVVQGNQTVRHYFKAPNGRNAVAQCRALAIAGAIGGDFTKSTAILHVRALELRVVDGPMTAAEAFADELGWAYAEALSDDDHAFERTPAAPATRADVVEWLGEERAARIDAHVRRFYYPEAKAS